MPPINTNPPRPKNIGVVNKKFLNQEPDTVRQRESSQTQEASRCSLFGCCMTSVDESEETPPQTTPLFGYDKQHGLQKSQISVSDSHTELGSTEPKNTNVFQSIYTAFQELNKGPSTNRLVEGANKKKSLDKQIKLLEKKLESTRGDESRWV